jgi:hypothetical protein
MNPIKEIKEWFNYGVKFGYYSIRIGFKLALVYGTIWTVSQLNCNKKNQAYNSIDNKINIEYSRFNNQTENIENYISYK